MSSKAASVAGFDGVENLPLAALEKVRPAQLGEHPKQTLAVEQHLSAGHRDDQQLAEVHAEGFAALVEDAHHAETPIAGAQPLAQGRARAEQLAP